MTGTVAVSGGAGYVGSALVPRLLARGYRVRVLDLFLFGRDVLSDHPGLDALAGDVRDAATVARWVAGADAVVHLAGVSNDPSCDLDPELSRSVNVDGSRTVIDAARAAGVGRFVYASSASVYGIADGAPVTEDAPLAPITVYGETKASTEQYLRGVAGARFPVVAVRPAAMYGYAPRLRLDLTVNLFANHAVNAGRVTVFGGTQLRPVVHVADACDLVLAVLDRRDTVPYEVFNLARSNRSVTDLAVRVVDLVNVRYGPQHATIAHTAGPADDRRSYAIDSDRARRVLGFAPRRSVADAVGELCDSFDGGLVPDPLGDDRYINVHRLKRLLGH